ncbi:MAG: signal peptidase I [Lachnospiraceae bacterium]|nr:signal peptidase I [Lachnospiraceae bacterium]
MFRRKRGLHFGREKKKVNFSLLKEIFIWGAEILLMLVIAFVLVLFIGMRTTVLGESMSPTLVSGEEVLVDRFIYILTEPKQDDIVVFLPNGNEKSHYYIKRVIGVPGDTIQIKSGVIYVNGEVYEEDLDASAIADAGLAEEEITVGEDEYFVLGDNRNNSEDSRYANIGNVKKEYIIGKAWFVISPWKNMRFVDHGTGTAVETESEETETEETESTVATE